MTTRLEDAVQLGWSRPDGFPALAAKDVHVWSTDLDEATSASQRLERLLTEDERRRAATLYFEKHRRRFIAARAMLRELLGRYLQVDPSELRFVLDAYGKPRLAYPTGLGAVHFNVAHSDGLALYAMACDRAVGVDVERVRADFSFGDIAAQFFSPDENAVLRAMAPRWRSERFYAYWTCKEAYLKAIGTGLSLPLESVHVEMGPEGGPAGLRIEGQPAEGSQWSIVQLTPSHGYTGALAVRGEGMRLACWRWCSSGHGVEPRIPGGAVHRALSIEEDPTTARTSCRT